MKLEPEVKKEILIMTVGCAVCSALVMAGFLIFGAFDYTVAIGAGVGFSLAVVNFYLMSIGVIRALETGDEVAAKMKMRSSYIARTILMVAVMAAAIILDFVHWLPVILSVFYPRIVIMVRNFIVAWKTRNDPTPVVESSSFETEKADTDEFEKFVSGFSKQKYDNSENNDGSAVK